MMEKQGIIDVVTASVAGSVTSYLVSVKRKKIRTLFDTLMHFGIGISTIFPAYFLSSYANLDTTSAMLVGYIFGVLGDRVVDYIYDKQNIMFNTFVQSTEVLEDSKKCSNND